MSDFQTFMIFMSLCVVALLILFIHGSKDV